MLFRSIAVAALGLVGFIAQPALAQSETGCICDGYETGINYDNGTSLRDAVLYPRSINGIGWCIKDGELLQYMQDEITNAINNKAVTSWVNGPWAIRFYGGVNNANPNLKVIIKTIINQITSLVELQMPPCDGIYPTDSNFVPTSCDPSCSWACDTGFTQCGDRSCIDPTLQTCSSGIPISNSKRALLPQCGANQIVCPVGKGWECLDTTSNLEACGGCPGQKSSVDCSTLPGVSDVQCRDSQCVAYRCARGYTLKNGKCVVAKRHW